MISELRIRNVGVIATSDVELAAGLNVITGETGTGKTMLLTALGLLLGGKADPSRVRAGAAKALVEGVWEATPAVRKAVDDLDGDLLGHREQADEGVLVARTVSAEGRSRAFLGGRGVPAATLASLADSLVVVHGQADQQRLARPATQRRLLDAYGGPEVADLLGTYRAAHGRLRQTREQMATLRASARDRAQRAEFLRHALEEIEAVDPHPDEETALAELEDRLANGEQLREAVSRALAQLSNDSDEQQRDARSALSQAWADLDAVQAHDPVLREPTARLRELVTEVTDVAAEITAYLTDLDVDPVRLDEVSQRRAAVTALLSRYGESTTEVLAWSQRAAAELTDLEDDGRLERLTAEVGELEQIVTAVARELSQARSVAAARLSEAITNELADLAMPRAEVVVSVSNRIAQAGIGAPAAGDIPLAVADETWLCGPHGADEVVFGLRPHPDADLLPLARSASGGELSRIMLAVEVTVAGDVPPPTLVFDEVDAGVGGAAAQAVGRRLARLAEHTQVIVVTHLAQVAACADHHLVVAKADEDGATDVMPLSGEARLVELARMLSGRADSTTARRHAEELLLDAGATRSDVAAAAGPGT